MKRPAIVWAAALSLLAAGPALGQGPDYVPQPQDILEITVWRNPDLTTEAEVDSEGNISLPLLGKVGVGGLTLRQLEDRLTELWGKDYLKNPHVRVALKTKQFFVLGEVKDPRAFDLAGNMTILKAISAAGGFTDFAKEGAVYIIRGNESERQKIDVDIDAIQKGKAPDIEIQPGDVITVPRSLF